MNLQQLRAYCCIKPGVTECFPFDEETLVFKVGSKMFALTNINKPELSVNLKCEPLMAESLRREYPSIKPGYHMNKRHWNTVEVSDSISEEKLKLLIDLSYRLVFESLKKSEKKAIE